MAINTPTPELALHHDRWKRNADFLAGSYTIKKKGEAYFPKPIPEMSELAFAAWLNSVTFFPAARRTHQGYKGLMFRKPPVFDASEAMLTLAKVITPDGDSHIELADRTADETLGLGLRGLFVDHPKYREKLSKADAIKAGQRAFINEYTALSILEITAGLVGNLKKLVHVRLLENDGERVRQLRLENGVYEVRVWDKIEGGEWQNTEHYRPTQNGKVMDHIPFFPCTPDGSIKPSVGVMDDIVELNHVHYLHQGELTAVYRFIGRPIPYVVNAKAPEGGWSIRPGTVWEITQDDADAKVEVGFNNMPSDGTAALIDGRDHLEDQMAKIGARLLASEKAAAEAAETHEIRRSSENATLASVANNISRSIEAALQEVATWMGDTQPVKYQINTDYIPQRMDSAEIQAFMALVQNGMISWETFFLMLRDRGAVDPSLDPEVEKDKIAEDETKRQAKAVANAALMAAQAQASQPEQPAA